MGSAKKKQQFDTLQGFIASLMYLNQEAKREGLDSIADIMQEAITSIGAWLDGKEAKYRKHELIDHSLFNSLEFLIKMAPLSTDKRLELVTMLEKVQAVNAKRIREMHGSIQ